MFAPDQAAAMTELHRASAIVIALGDDVRTALDELETQSPNATHQKTRLGEAEERYAAVEKTRYRVEADGKTTLEGMSRAHRALTRGHWTKDRFAAAGGAGNVGGA